MTELKSIEAIKDKDGKVVPGALCYVIEHDNKKIAYHIPTHFTQEEVDNSLLSYIDSLDQEKVETPNVNDFSIDKMRERADAREEKRQLEIATSRLMEYVQVFTPLADQEQKTLDIFESLPTEDEDGNKIEKGPKPDSTYLGIIAACNKALESNDTNTITSQFERVREAIPTLPKK